MRKTILIVLCVLGVGVSSYAQVVFNKVYHKSDVDGGYEIIETSDGGYLITASYSGGGIGGSLILKLNNLGDTIWSKDYNLSIGLDRGLSIIELTNNNYVLCGVFADTTTNPITAGAYLMKLDAQGDSLWLKQYGSVDADWMFSLAQTPDGGFVMAGHQVLAPSFSQSDAWVVKTDSLGNMLWQKQFDEHGFSELIEGLVVNADSTIVIGGTTLLSSSTSRAYMVKLTPNGDIIWRKEFGGPIATDIFNMDTTTDKGYIIAGNTIISGEQRAYVAKLDSLGNIIWENDFARGNGPSENYSFAAIHELPNGNFMAAGADYDYTQTQPGDAPRIRLFELNNLGDSIWSKQYTHYGGLNDDYVFDMKLTSDGDYIMCGYIINGSLPQKNDVLVIKVDSNGCDDTACQNSVGIEETSTSGSMKGLKVYPNPNNGSFTIDIDNIENAVVQIYNISGQIVQQTIMQGNTEVIDISEYSNGLYLLKLSNNNQVITKRIIKH